MSICTEFFVFELDCHLFIWVLILVGIGILGSGISYELTQIVIMYVILWVRLVAVFKQINGEIRALVTC